MTQFQRFDPIEVGEEYRGIFAHGVEVPAASRTLYISGQIGVAPDGSLAKEFRGQCRQALTNLGMVLEAADMSFSDIVKTTFFLTRPSDMGELVKVRKEMIDGVRPANTTVFISGLVSPDWLVEVEAIACASA